MHPRHDRAPSLCADKRRARQFSQWCRPSCESLSLRTLGPWNQWAIRLPIGDPIGDPFRDPLSCQACRGGPGHVTPTSGGPAGHPDSLGPKRVYTSARRPTRWATCLRNRPYLPDKRVSIILIVAIGFQFQGSWPLNRLVSRCESHPAVAPVQQRQAAGGAAGGLASTNGENWRKES